MRQIRLAAVLLAALLTLSACAVPSVGTESTAPTTATTEFAITSAVTTASTAVPTMQTTATTTDVATSATLLTTSSAQTITTVLSTTVATTTATTVPATMPKGELTPGEEVDFVVDVPAGRDIRILQLSDLQIGRLTEGEICRDSNYRAPFAPDSQHIVWRYVDEAVSAAKPDLIVLNGDNVEGWLDDNGQDWLEVCARMDSYRIPWLLVFGNHDRESLMGPTWQIQQLKNSHYCLFATRNVTGDSNYSVAIRQGGRYKYVLWLVDTNGTNGQWTEGNPDADRIVTWSTIGEDQLDWIRTASQSIEKSLGKSLPSLMFMHIPPMAAFTAVRNSYPDSYQQRPFLPDKEGDFGRALEQPGGGYNSQIFSLAQSIGCTGMFFAHQHEVAISLMYRDIRLTWGLKTGTYSYSNPLLRGSTLITIDEQDDAMAVEYLHSKL